MMGLSNAITVKYPELLVIDDDGHLNYGANQIWYKSYWKRQAGCGPTACALLIWYISHTHENCKNLCEHNTQNRVAFLQIMEEVWEYVTPTIMGLNSTSLFINGVVKYAEKKGVSINCRNIEIPKCKTDRPSNTQLNKFISDAVADDLLIAFLNLSNGDIANLDKWHWVVIVGKVVDTDTVIIYDQGNCKEIDMSIWLSTTTTGGGLVAIYP